MMIVLPAMAVAFAAICVWLTVRVVNRRERWAKWTLGAVVWLPLVGYSGAYLMLVEPFYTGRFAGTVEVYFGLDGHVIDHYEFWERVFRPANALDRKIRPELWRE